ncbi:MAG: multi-sensor signal transduction histidine kinase, partial [Myxococcaceae bacterium]|nr:multi-sensor signal transduction histidine kinase [Myxococcaceae bacterium]
MARTPDDPTRPRLHERERLSQRLVMRELVSRLAHDVNQPLAAVITNANACRRWLSHDVPDLGEASAAAERISHEGHRASQVIERMRLQLQGSEPVPEAVQLEQVLQQWLLDTADDARATGATL